MRTKVLMIIRTTITTEGFNPDYSVGSNNQSYGNDPYGDSESYRERHSFFENGQQNVAPNYNETVNSYEWGTASK